MMNVLLAACRVERTPANRNDADSDELSKALDFPTPKIDWAGFTGEMAEYWLTIKLDTDTNVGVSAGFIGDEVVYIRKQTGRNSGASYYFISVAAAEMVKSLLIKHAQKKVPSLLRVNASIDDFYTVGLSNEIVRNNGFYKGQAVTHVHSSWYKSYERDIFVVIDETQEKVTIPCSEYLIPIHLATEEAAS